MYKLMNFKFSDAPTKRPSDSPTGDDKYKSVGVKKMQSLCVHDVINHNRLN